MIDSIIVSPVTHMIVGTIVLLTNLFFLFVVGRLAWKKHTLSPLANATFILFQLALITQTLVGIKLLDQGLGVLQLYIHYLGGAASLAFCLLYYWLPTRDELKQSRRLAVVAVASFLFVFLTFVVGSIADVSLDSAESPQPITQITSLTGDPVRGKTLYDAYGAGAHGISGEGVAGLGTSLNNANQFIADHTDAELVHFLRTGRDPNDPDNVSGTLMPPNGGIPNATDQDLYDIVAYLRTL
ncbi:MAG: hypothetical protein CSB13_01520 [Chloroflexi bacterium]|nr:MAG: hypothetical protein CSB13_01520 [Chloroflexota bacterium]